MTIAIVIPARYQSSRYPGKPLAQLRGAGGVAKTLLQRSYEAALEVDRPVRIYVATDDDRIAAEAERIGAEAVMTSPDCANGTERCRNALRHLPQEPEIVVNLQGDAPLTPPWFVEALIDAMLADPNRQVATPALRCDADTLAMFREDRRAGRVGGTTMTFTAAGDALYFSKEVIPYADAIDMDGPIPVFHHVGLYAYRAAALKRYGEWPAGPLEQIEGLEQLRFLENGAPISCVEVDARGQVFWELNNPVDVPRIETALAQMGVD